MTRVSPDTREGEDFAGPVHKLSIERLLAFSGGPIGTPDWPARNLHTDIAKAREAGLSAPIASGLQAQGPLIRLMLDLFGEAWSREGRMHLKFLRPVEAGDSVQAKVRVRSKERGAETVTFELDAWCENGNAESVLAGWVACSVPLESG